MGIDPQKPAENEPIDHHFMPIFYQSAWAEQDGRVIRYSRPRDKVVAKSCDPTRTGSEKFLYSHHGVPPEHRAYLETQFFSPVDSNAAVAHAILIEKGVAGLSPDQRVHWARYMMSTQLRHPFALAELWRLADQNLRAAAQISDEEYEAVRKPEDPATVYDWTLKHQPHVIENIHKTFLPNLIDHDGLGAYLINMDWMVIDVSPARHALLTGDRPLIATHGWKNPLTTLLFPLSPNKLFVATNGKRQTSSLLQRNSPNELVRYGNDQIACCAIDFVIGSNDSHLSFVERRLRHPDKEPIPSPFGKGQPNCPS